MITGAVRAGEARIRLTVRGPRRREEEIEAVIDTGYTGWLTLPTTVIDAMDLRWHSVERGILADGSECLFDVYEASVLWDGLARRILVDEAETDPLLGMALLAGHELRVQVTAGGKVTIQRLA